MAAAPKPRELDVARIRRWVQERVPPEHEDEVKLEIVVRGANVTIYELRSPWCDEVGPDWSRRPVVQLRHTGGGFWLLLWPDRRDRWQRYPPAPSQDETSTHCSPSWTRTESATSGGEASVASAVSCRPALMWNGTDAAPGELLVSVEQPALLAPSSSGLTYAVVPPRRHPPPQSGPRRGQIRMSFPRCRGLRAASGADRRRARLLRRLHR